MKTEELPDHRYLSVGENIEEYVGKEVFCRWSTDCGDETYWEKGILVSVEGNYGEFDKFSIGSPKFNSCKKGRWKVIISEELGEEIRIFEWCAIAIKEPSLEEVEENLKNSRKLQIGEGDKLLQEAAELIKKYTEPRYNGYVGMPTALYLDDFARLLKGFFNTEIYLVGSALECKDWHDLDVCVILPDDKFKEFGKPEDRFLNEKWISLCLAFSALGEKMIGSKVDFQIQQKSYADTHCKGSRLVIGKDKKKEE